MRECVTDDELARFPDDDHGDGSKRLPMLACPGCSRRFGVYVPVVAWIPHDVIVEPVDSARILTRYPLCDECAEIWRTERREAFVSVADHVADEWLEMHRELERFRRG